MPYPSTPATWVAGDVLTAAQMNAQLRDALLGAFPLGPPDVAWSNYTPTLTQSVTVAKTITYAKYTRIGRTVHFAVDLTATATGTAGQDIIVGLPLAATTSNYDIGSGFIYDASAVAGFAGLVEIWSQTGFKCRSMTAAAGFLGSATFTAALASGDLLRFSGTYESAT